MPGPRQLRRIVPIVLTLLPLFGCGKTDSTPASASKSAQTRIGVSLASVDDAIGARLKSDIETAARSHPDWQIVFVDAQDDAARQRAQLDEFLSGGMKVVMLSPVDVAAATDPVARLMDAGIPVILLNRAILGEKYTCLVAGNPKQVGTEVGQWLADRLHGKGKIVALRGPVESRWANEVHEAWQIVLRDPAYRVIFNEHVHLPKVDAARLMTMALERFNDIDAVVAHDNAAAWAAYQTAKAAGREKGVFFVGAGGPPIDDGDKGDVAAIVTPSGGAEAIDVAAKLLHGEKVPKKLVPAVQWTAPRQAP